MPTRKADSPRARRTEEAGFTLVEVAVGITILALTLGAVGSLLISSSSSFSNQVTLSRVQTAGSQVLNRLSAELLSLDQTTLTPVIMADATSISFQSVTGYNGTGNDLGPVTTVELRLVNGEKENGADDNGDGRVDEGLLVLVQGGATTILARDIVGLRFNTTGTGLRAEVDIAVVDRNDEVISRTFTRRWAFRN